MSNFSLNSEAVRRYLVRALAGDSERPRSPITLAGPSNGTPSSGAPSTLTSSRPAWPQPPSNHRDRDWLAVAEPEPGDEQGPYEYAELVRMDQRFRARLLRAFERGTESRAAATARHSDP